MIAIFQMAFGVCSLQTNLAILCHSHTHTLHPPLSCNSSNLNINKKKKQNWISFWFPMFSFLFTYVLLVLTSTQLQTKSFEKNPKKNPSNKNQKKKKILTCDPHPLRKCAYFWGVALANVHMRVVYGAHFVTYVPQRVFPSVFHLRNVISCAVESTNLSSNRILNTEKSLLLIAKWWCMQSDTSAIGAMFANKQTKKKKQQKPIFFLLQNAHI